MNHKKIIIVRDPRTVELKFLEGQPVELEDKMTNEEWISFIREINEAILDKVSTKGIFLSLLGHSKDQFLEIDSMVEKANLKFKERGIYFCNPKSLQFQEMEVIVKL